MIGFQAVTLSWQGQDYVVAAENQLALIAILEDALGGSQALEILLRPGGPPYSRLARAYGAALRYAGADVSDDEIYLSIVNDFAQRDSDVATRVNAAILGLLSIIVPPVGLALTEEIKKKPDPEQAKALDPES